jgi:hypothetical protein
MEMLIRVPGILVFNGFGGGTIVATTMYNNIGRKQQ